MTEKQIERALSRSKIDLAVVRSERIPWEVAASYLAKHLFKELQEKTPTKHHERAREVLDTLNTLCGRNFRDTETNLSIISARLNETGVTAGEVCKMIRRQVLKWKGTDMEEYLRPETLFRASKFETYYANRDFPISNTAERKRPALRGENC